MRFTFTLLLLFITCLFIASCNKGPTGGIPFYLKMDTAVIVAPRGVPAGSNTQGIQDVWVEEGANNIGAYELPCNFPVLDHDSVRFVMNPGIWPSGQSTNPVAYPLMNPDVFTMEAVPGKQYTHVPTFTYKAADSLQFNEDFELGSDYNTNMVTTGDSVKYGRFCGKITVGPNDSSVIACQQHASGGIGGNVCPYPLRPGQLIWLELDYESDVPFWSGIIESFSSGASDTVQVVLLLPSQPYNTWSKQYIDLSAIVGNSGASNFSLFFQGLNPSGNAGGNVYLDNIRLIHLQQ
jgi:hypothetical protein